MNWAAKGATIAIEWRHADQGGHLLAAEGAQLGQLGQQGRRHGGADPGHTAQHVLLFPPEWAGAQRLANSVAGSFNRLRSQAVWARMAAGAAAPVILSDQHLDQLAAPRHQSGQAWVVASGSGRTVGRTASAKWAST
jgi:hypothetical protein